MNEKKLKIMNNYNLDDYVLQNIFSYVDIKCTTCLCQYKNFRYIFFTATNNKIYCSKECYEFI